MSGSPSLAAHVAAAAVEQEEDPATVHKHCGRSALRLQAVMAALPSRSAHRHRGVNTDWWNSRPRPRGAGRRSHASLVNAVGRQPSISSGAVEAGQNPEVGADSASYFQYLYHHAELGRLLRSRSSGNREFVGTPVTTVLSLDADSTLPAGLKSIPASAVIRKVRQADR